MTMTPKIAKRVSMLSIGMALVALCACAGPITDEDNGKRYEFSEDTEFVVELAGNPTTGYAWSVTGYDAEVVKPLGEPQYTADSDRIGSGGIYTFRFRTAGAGESDVAFSYARPWEKDNPPAKTFRITVVCGTMGVIEER